MILFVAAVNKQEAESIDETVINVMINILLVVGILIFITNKIKSGKRVYLNGWKQISAYMYISCVCVCITTENGCIYEVVISPVHCRKKLSLVYVVGLEIQLVC